MDQEAENKQSCAKRDQESSDRIHALLGECVATTKRIEEISDEIRQAFEEGRQELLAVMELLRQMVLSGPPDE